MDIESYARRELQKGRSGDDIKDEIAGLILKIKFSDNLKCRDSAHAIADAVIEEVKITRAPIKDSFVKKLLTPPLSQVTMGQIGVGSRGVGDFFVHERIGKLASSVRDNVVTSADAKDDAGIVRFQNRREISREFREENHSEIKQEFREEDNREIKQEIGDYKSKDDKFKYNKFRDDKFKHDKSKDEIFIITAVDGTHSRLSDYAFIAGFHVARAALRDVYVTGGDPVALIDDLHLADDGDVGRLFDFVAGVSAVGELVGVPLVAGSTLRIGGDMVIGERMVSCVAAIGVAGSEDITPRDRVEVGDKILMTSGAGGGTIATTAIYSGNFDTVSETMNVDFLIAAKALQRSGLLPQVHAMLDVTNGGLRGDANEILAVLNTGKNIPINFPANNDAEKKKQIYKQYAPLYDEDRKKALGDNLINEKYNLLEKSLGSGSRVLDLGCGSGKQLEIISDKIGNFGFCSAIDISKDMIENARKKLDPEKEKIVEFIEGDVLEGIPFPDETFDIVTSFDLLQEMPSNKQEFVISEIYRVLKKGGTFIGTTTATCSKSDALNPGALDLFFSESKKYLWYFYEYESVERSLEKIFDSERCETFFRRARVSGPGDCFLFEPLKKIEGKLKDNGFCIEDAGLGVLFFKCAKDGKIPREIGLRFYENKINKLINPKIYKLLKDLNIDPLGVSIDSLMIFADERTCDEIMRVVRETGVDIDVVGEVVYGRGALLICDDGSEGVLDAHFRESGYTKIKKMIGESTPGDFEDMKIKVEGAYRGAIKKREEIVDYVRNLRKI